MPDRILTTHVGSLPRPEQLIALNQQRSRAGRPTRRLPGGADGGGRRRRAPPEGGRHRPRQRRRVRPHDGLRLRLRLVVVLRLRRLGGSSWSRRPSSGRCRCRSTPRSRASSCSARSPSAATGTSSARPTWTRSSGCALPEPYLSTAAPSCRGPISYSGHEALARDIANLKAALEAAGIEEGWMNSVAPASCARFAQRVLRDRRGAALRLRRRDARGVQGDRRRRADPAARRPGDRRELGPDRPTSRASRPTGASRWSRIEALNHAIRGLPPDRIRFHLCWGSWHGPHVTDIPMADIVDVMLAVNADCYSFEAANVRHEHEWRVWQDVKLPDGKVILPGVVSHAHQRRRASRARRRPDRALRRGGRARERDRLDRLRARRPRAPADRLGQARGARRGRRAGDQASSSDHRQDGSRVGGLHRP